MLGVADAKGASVSSKLFEGRQRAPSVGSVQVALGLLSFFRTQPQLHEARSIDTGLLLHLVFLTAENVPGQSRGLTASPASQRGGDPRNFQLFERHFPCRSAFVMSLTLWKGLPLALLARLTWKNRLASGLSE
jgi:hypothetical protein